jgi:hypothetical protein
VKVDIITVVVLIEWGLNGVNLPGDDIDTLRETQKL